MKKNKEISILILGTSNSVAKGGWTYGFRAALPGAKIDSFTVGGSDCVQFSSQMRRDFSKYDCVLFDSVPNDEKLIMEGGSIDYQRRIFFEMASTISSKSRFISVCIPRQDYLNIASESYRERCYATHMIGGQCIDFRDLINNFGYQLLEGDERLYEDEPHPNRKIACVFGFLLGMFMESFIGMTSIQNKNSDFSKNFIFRDIFDICKKERRVRKENSLMGVDFCEFTPGDIIELRKDGNCVGLYMDKSDTKCRAKINFSHGGERKIKLLFKDKPNIFSYYFMSLNKPEEIKDIVIESRLVKEPGFPDGYDDLPHRALISSILFWNGVISQNIKGISCEIDPYWLHGEIKKSLHKDVQKWRKAINLYRCGLDAFNSGNDVKKEIYYRQAYSQFPDIGERARGIDKILRVHKFLPVTGFENK